MKANVFSAAVMAASTAASLLLIDLRPPTGLAAPSEVSLAELAALTLAFFLLVVIMQPAKCLLARMIPGALKLLERRLELSDQARVGAILTASVGAFIFSFWAVADVLGGYNGYQYSFSAYPFLHFIYVNLGVRYLDRYVNAGDQATLFFLLAVLGVAALMANGGAGTALKNSVTLFAAPSLIVFELALWLYAPQDMSWHVTTSLYLGGLADGGWRAAGSGGSYLVSNWLVLFVSLFAVASRIPFLSLPSMILQKHLGRS